jgi:hypothetical protein
MGILCAGLRLWDIVQLGPLGHRIAGGSGTPRCPGARPVAVSRGREGKRRRSKRPHL